jgi:hypothetical protein
MLAEYKPLIMYMCANKLACDVAKANIIVLFNVHIPLGFYYFMPLLGL